MSDFEAKEDSRDSENTTDLSKTVFGFNDQLDAKIADFGGSSLDGSPLLIAVTASHRSPGPSLSIQGDLFALGSTMYSIMTGDAPYATIDEEEIRALYAQSKFAETTELGPIGHLITNCWQGRYHAANTVVAGITAILCPPIIPAINI
ncbi:hypothetical protein LZ554_009026 [Drepanopeziza brunnea f. sp. 'monogermtubi']|nr:hypothetical protein LZ554_009026 [Drepanopeziza brunnea f. sp. 'monogermtubi']